VKEIGIKFHSWRNSPQIYRQRRIHFDSLKAFRFSLLECSPDFH